MKPEQLFKNRFRNLLFSMGASVSFHEDRYTIGTPDISYGLNGVNGWIEAKYLDKWPKSGVVKIDHYTPQQKNWLMERGKAGGKCFLLVGVGSEMMLFDHETAQDVGEMQQHTMVISAKWCSNTNCPQKILLNVLTK